MTEKVDEDLWEFLDTLEAIIRRATTGDSAALKILQAVAGERATELMRIEAKKTVPRMNTCRPPTPNPELYLQGMGPRQYFTYP